MAQIEAEPCSFDASDVAPPSNGDRRGNTILAKLSWGHGRRILPLLFGAMVLVVNIGIGLYVHSMLSTVSDSLPVDMISQERDMVQIGQNFSDLMIRTEVARNNATDRNVGSILQSLYDIQVSTEELRRSQSFDRITGAAALHAAISPAISDMDSWLTHGLYGHPPKSPVILELVYNRARETGEKVRDLLLDNHVSAMGLLSIQQERLSTFRNSLIALLVLVGLLCVGGSIGFIRYLEQRRQTESALRHAMEEAEFANRAKSQFLANMSHELRTPLNAIIGFAEILKDPMISRGEDAKGAEYAEDIHKSGIHLLSLINDLLDLSKIEAGRATLSDDTIQLPYTVAATLRLVETRAEKHGITLVKSVASGAELIRADERKLKQILLNLLSNAVKFTPEGGRIEVSTALAGSGALLISVSDNGIGIAEADIPKVMSPFGQVESSLNRRFEGSGLGLPLVKALAELHGGDMDLDSEPNVGTTVTVILPADRILQHEPQSRQPEAAAQ
ncbi:HAMP domain-containing sensor histidine kinase [Fodinicurvata sp. EGI_FJ10296]|uniref:sensor histidine kinase n=1 Tax=Fodinicurvata sp. EGI_FJ10296 TaxID=3231908 RepID=UPI003453B760